MQQLNVVLQHAKIINQNEYITLNKTHAFIKQIQQIFKKLNAILIKSENELHEI